jgi:alpha-ketoglutarate-dependent 2,4-dichlorophenoxyacetate dioxygenase|uniref:TauD/TfdA family dioxygenase n=1 Tax=Acidicaldus sp. TaxID=1872105 RepID=A0A8J4M6R2_9PROT
MNLAITPLHPLFAAEIGGIDAGRALDAPAVEALTAAINRYAVLVLRDQRLNDDQQIAFASNFGRPEINIGVYRSADQRRLERPEMADVSNVNARDEVHRREDQRRMFNLGNMLWHTDSSFRYPPGALSMLYAHAVPSSGGETEFADLRAAHDALDAATRALIADLRAEHSIMHSRATLGFTEFSETERAALPPVVHRVVRRHPGSGRTTLYLASHASHIIGWPVPEGRLLLRDLIEFATRREFVFVHHWRVGDLVIWDNRCTLHRGRPFPAEERRDLRRVTTSDTAAALEQAA